MFDTSFLKSSRFQALVALAIVFLLGQYGILPDEIVTAFATILGGHIGIRTIDRATEKLGNSESASGL